MGGLVLTNESKKPEYHIETFRRGGSHVSYIERKPERSIWKGRKAPFTAVFSAIHFGREKSAILPEKEGGWNEMLENGLFPKGFQGAWCRRQKKMWWKKDWPLVTLNDFFLFRRCVLCRFRVPALCALRNLTLSYITSQFYHHGYEVSKESSLETLKKNLKTRRTNANWVVGAESSVKAMLHHFKQIVHWPPEQTWGRTRRQHCCQSRGRVVVPIWRRSAIDQQPRSFLGQTVCHLQTCLALFLSSTPPDIGIVASPFQRRAKEKEEDLSSSYRMMKAWLERIERVLQ